MKQTAYIVPEPGTVPLSVVMDICMALDKARNPNGMPLTADQQKHAVRAALLFQGIND